MPRPTPQEVLEARRIIMRDMEARDPDFRSRGGKASVKKRFEGMTKEQKSEMMKKVRNRIKL